MIRHITYTVPTVYRVLYDGTANFMQWQPKKKMMKILKKSSRANSDLLCERKWVRYFSFSIKLPVVSLIDLFSASSLSLSYTQECMNSLPPFLPLFLLPYYTLTKTDPENKEKSDWKMLNFALFYFFLLFYIINVYNLLSTAFMHLICVV